MNLVKRKNEHKTLRPVILLTLLYTVIYGKGNALLGLAITLPSFLTDKNTSVPVCLGAEAFCLLTTSLLLWLFDLFTLRAWLICLLLGTGCFWGGKGIQKSIPEKWGNTLCALVHTIAFGSIMSLMRV